MIRAPFARTHILIVAIVMFGLGWVAAGSGSGSSEAASPCPPQTSATVPATTATWGSQAAYAGVATTSGPQNWHAGGVTGGQTQVLGNPNAVVLASTLPTNAPTTGNANTYPAVSCRLDSPTVLLITNVSIGAGSQIQYQFGSSPPLTYTVPSKVPVVVKTEHGTGNYASADVEIPAPPGASGACVASFTSYTAG